MSLGKFTTLSILTLLVFLTLVPDSTFGQEKLTLNRNMLYNFSTKGDAGLLVDEQVIANDPATGHGGTPTTVFTPGWINAAVYYPAMIVLDLWKLHSLTSLWLFDLNDQDTVSIYTGDPSSWQKKEDMYLDKYMKWREVPLQTTTRFLMLKYRSPHTRIAEIVLYGEATGEAVPPPIPVERPKPFIDQFMGVNGFIDDPVNKLNCTGNMREYHNWSWDEGNRDTTYPGYPNNQCAWNPSWVSGPGWGFYFDDFYSQLQDTNLLVSPVLQGSAFYVAGFDESRMQYKPVSLDKNPLDPLSYIEHSDYIFQFAARYGQTAVSPSLLKLRADQPVISGSGLAGYLENWNEPNKWWYTRKGYFTPDEFSTMCSTDYDGHENTLGPGKGMKTADPAIKMVMGGLVDLDPEYLRCMKLWCDFNRQTGFPADVLNFHHYSNKNDTIGISPEEDSLKQRLKEVVALRDTCLPGKEIWLSEFGYDTNPESFQAAVAIDTNDIYEVQGEWILRSYLEAIAAGIDKAFVFMLRDVNSANPNKYNSSGLTNESWAGYRPKKSWYYVYTMKGQLSRLRFENEIPSGHDSVNVYRFLSAEGDTTVYAVWCSSSSNRIIENFKLGIGSCSWARLALPQYRMPEGYQSYLEILNDTVTFRVTERPVFIRTLKGGNPIPFENNVYNVVVGDGEFQCFNAIQKIRVAGNGTTFLVRSGGSATLIAGQRISLLPGATVDPGGALSAYISTSGTYCPGENIPSRNVKNVKNEETLEIQPKGKLFRVHPNPTTGRFTIELNPGVNPLPMTVFLYGNQGEIIMKQEIEATREKDFFIDKNQSGIFIIRLIMGDRVETAKIIRMK